MTGMKPGTHVYGKRLVKRLWNAIADEDFFHYVVPAAVSGCDERVAGLS